MIYNNRLFNTRKELKRYLGGTRQYNKALKSGEIHNIYQEESNNLNPEKPDVPLNKNDAFQKVQKRRVQEKR